MLLSDGALPACCAAVQQSTDAHHKFHAVSALAFCLDRIRQCLQVRTISKLSGYTTLPTLVPVALLAKWALRPTHCFWVQALLSWLVT